MKSFLLYGLRSFCSALFMCIKLFLFIYRRFTLSPTSAQSLQQRFYSVLNLGLRHFFFKPFVTLKWNLFTSGSIDTLNYRQTVTIYIYRNIIKFSTKFNLFPVDSLFAYCIQLYIRPNLLIL